MGRAALPLLVAALGISACGALLGVESITVTDEAAIDAGPADTGPIALEDGTVPDSALTCAVGATRPCNGHPEDGIGACRAGTQSCAFGTWTVCAGDIGPSAETCDAVDKNCNGIPGIDEPALPVPANAMNCTKMFACAAPGRGALFFRTGIGFTNVAGANTEWTAFAPRGDFSDGTNPPGTFRISRDETATKLGPVTAGTLCCPSTGCPTANVFFDGQGQYYTKL